MYILDINQRHVSAISWPSSQWNLLHSGYLRQSTWWWPWIGCNMSLVNI